MAVEHALARCRTADRRLPMTLGVADAGGGAFDPDGPVAREMAELWWIMLVLGTIAFVVFLVALAVGLRRRASADGDVGREAGGGPAPASLRRLVVGGGVVMPAVLLVAVLVFTVGAMRATPQAAGDGALRIDVIGHQWWYEVRYPEHGFTTANEIHLPVGREVELHLTSADVIHSFWVPQLGGKIDMLPDGENLLVLQADEPGVHVSRCAEFCGLQHTKMGAIVVAEPEVEFATWIESMQAEAASPSRAASSRGQEVFMDRCASCHTIRGTDADGASGPELTHLASRRSLAAASLDHTEDNLRTWIVDPHSVKQGVDMPAATDLGEADVDALVAYLEGLR